VIRDRDRAERRDILVCTLGEADLSARIQATVTVNGDASQLQAYRREVNLLLAEDGEEGFRELHTQTQLEYAFSLRAGIPFPPFVLASQAFPELRVEVAWTEPAEGRSGRATIQGGALREQTSGSSAAGGPLLQAVRADPRGELALALACRRSGRGWHGYVLSCASHAFFRIDGDANSGMLRAADGVEAAWAERWTISGGDAQYAQLAEPEAIEEDELHELDRLAQDFVQEWIWFDESPPEETAVERQRYGAYGIAVRPANLRSAKLQVVLQPGDGGRSFSSFDPASQWIVELIERRWLTPAP
jgi:hypothetical protein